MAQAGELMDLNRKILHVAFVMPTRRISQSAILSVLYWLFTPTAFALYSLILTSQVLGVYHYWGDIDATMEDLFLTLGFVMCYWEGAYFKLKKQQIWKIFDILDTKPFPEVHDPKLNKIHTENMKEVLSQCRFASWFIFLSVNVGTVMWAIFPLVNLAIHSMSEEDHELRQQNKPWPYLMFIVWVPYDETTMPMYAVTYAVQVFVYFTASLYNTASNIVFINLILHATGKFKIVESSFRHLEEVLSRTDTADVEDFLVNCIKQHQEAIS
jgi:7tm Odorant receptor.